MKKLILFSLFIIGSYYRIYSQEPAIVAGDKAGWKKIAETTVNFKTETDEIIVMGADRFAFIKINVTDAPIHLVSFDIYFDGGDKQSVTIGKEIKAPGESRTVQLNGGERSIKKVSFIYKTVADSQNKRAHVELWGLKTNSDKKTNK